MSQAKCPICQRSADAVYRPFCSRRCADLDLHRWLSGAYGLPMLEDDDPDGSRDRDHIEGAPQPNTE